MTTSTKPERPAIEPLSAQLARCLAEIERRSQAMADVVLAGFGRRDDDLPPAA